MLKSIMRSFGVGGARIDTVLDNPEVQVGGTLSGEVRITGGQHEQEIRGVELELATRCFAERNGGDKTYSDFTLGAATLNPGIIRSRESRTLPFQIRLPAMTPISLGSTQTVLRTRLDVAGAVDPRDADPIRVRPNAAIAAVLQGMERAGFRLVEAEVEWNARRAKPLVQEFDFRPTSRGDWGIEEVELSFTPTEWGAEVLLTVDNRGGLFLPGRERTTRFDARERDLGRLDMAEELRRAIASLRR
jgi:sporulation-control protein